MPDEPIEIVPSGEAVIADAPDDGSKELGIIEQAMAGQVPVVKEGEAVIADAPKEPTTEVTEEPAEIEEGELLKKYGLKYGSIEELAAKHKELETSYSNRLEPLNWAAKNAPGLLGEFYAKLNRQLMQAQGLPVPEEGQPQEQIADELSNLIDPNTGDPYTSDQINAMTKIVAAMARREGFVKKSDLESEKAQERQVNVQKQAVKNITDFQTAWEPRLKEMGLAFDTVLKGMADEMAVFGIGENDFAKVTPEVLGRALNQYLIGIPGGLEMLMKNYAANAQKNNDSKKGKARIIPKGGVRTDTQAPSNIDALLESGDFKGAEAILERQLRGFRTGRRVL